MASEGDGWEKPESDGDVRELDNQPHDAAISVDDAADVPSPTSEASPRQPESPDAADEGGGGVGNGELRNAPHDYAMDMDGDDQPEVESPPQRAAAPPPAATTAAPAPMLHSPMRGNDSPSSIDSSRLRRVGGDGGTPTASAIQTGEYDPARYTHLDVDDAVKEMFKFITAFTPTRIELAVPLKPFIPEYIASVGEIDVFVKVPRPDGKADNLGLVVLDEPSAKQSSPPIVWIEMTYMETGSTVSAYVESVQDAVKRPLLLDNWVKSVDEIHRNAKPSSSVSYSKPMPTADQLLEVWPSEFEEQLSKPEIQIPPGDLDVDLVEYSKICCALVDIPVYQKPIESLHAFFTLYADFKQNVHFQANAFGND